MKTIYIFYYISFAFFYTGFLFHKSISPSIFNYSIKYFIFLLFLATGFLFPIFIKKFIKKIGFKNFLFTLLPAIALIFLVYIFSHYKYYIDQKHLFDPFLQFPPHNFDIIKEKNKDEFRILTLGGSTTAKGYPGILQKILQKKYPSLKITVLNAGVLWYTTEHSLINYVTYCREFKPDLTIIMHAINDLYRSFSPSNYAIGDYNDRYSHFYGPSINGAIPPTFEKFLLERYFSVINRWFDIFRYKEVNFKIEKYKSINIFKETLKKLVHYIKSDGSKCIIVTQAFLYKKNMPKEELKTLWMGRHLCYEKKGLFIKRYRFPSPRSLANAMKRYNKTAYQVADLKGVLCVDAEKVLRKNLEYFIDDVHYTKKGVTTLAKVIAENILQYNLIKWGNIRHILSDGGLVAIRPGDVHSADGWQEFLEPIYGGCQFINEE